MNRIKQLFYLLGMLLTTLLYCSVLLIFYPIFFIGNIFQKNDTFWEGLHWFIDRIPEIPETKK